MFRGIAADKIECPKNYEPNLEIYVLCDTLYKEFKKIENNANNFSFEAYDLSDLSKEYSKRVKEILQEDYQFKGITLCSIGYSQGTKFNIRLNLSLPDGTEGDCKIMVHPDRLTLENVCF